MSLNKWITQQEQRGITSFSFQQIRQAFHNRSENTLKTDINRLSSSKRIQNVYKGFYVIIPTQYQLKGVVPPTYYINELMEYLGKPYYVGLLSAAALFGASHQKAMLTQVVTTGPRSRISNKNTLLDWNYRQHIPSELIVSQNAEMGRINYSSAELTAVDIIQFASNIGGYQRAATVLAELVDSLDISKMECVLPYTTITTMQRLGYLLEFVVFDQDKADMLYDIVKKRNGYFNTVLMSTDRLPSNNARRNRWRVNMNIDIELDQI